MAKRHPKRNVTGRFVGVPLFVIETEIYVKLSLLAKCLLYELCAQYNGRNNGYLSLTRNDLALRGFVSPPSTQNAVSTLVESGLIIKTRQGGIAKGRGGKHTCSLYAITWYPIDENLNDPLDNTKLPFTGSFQVWFTERTKRVPMLKR